MIKHGEVVRFLLADGFLMPLFGASLILFQDCQDLARISPEVTSVVGAPGIPGLARGEHVLCCVVR